MARSKERTELEDKLAWQMEMIGLVKPVREYKFHPTRGWRFDFAWPALRLAVEVEGAVYTGGRHTRGKGFEEDADKYNAAASLGWCVFRFTRKRIEDGSALTMIEGQIIALEAKG